MRHKMTVTPNLPESFSSPTFRRDDYSEVVTFSVYPAKSTQHTVRLPKWLSRIIRERVQRAYTDGRESVQKAVREAIGIVD